MNRLVDITSYLGRAFAAVAGIATSVVMLLIASDVVLRFMGSGVPGTLEIITYYLMVIVAFVALAHLERQDGMISVDIVYGAFDTRAKRGMIVLSGFISALVLGGVTYASALEALSHYRSGTYVATLRYDLPTWPAYFLVPLAFGLAAAMAALRVVIAAFGDRSDRLLHERMGLGDLVEPRMAPQTKQEPQ